MSHLGSETPLVAAFVAVMHALGVLTSIRAVMSTRTSQGAVAWVVSLNTLPYIAVPAYWALGQSKFDGYDLLRRSEQLAQSTVATKARKSLEQEGLSFQPASVNVERHCRILDSLSKLPITTGNTARLLVNGHETFDAIIEGIGTAKEYVLFQFYILRDDELGQRCKDALVERAAAGVRVYVLYDDMGSKDLSTCYVNDLRQAGVEVFPFNTTQGKGHRFRVNFRNHRKIVIVDGHVGYVGGHNVGDDYLDKDPVLSPWRDTHMEIRGPAVQCLQAPFVEDWYWAAKSMPELNWVPKRADPGDADHGDVALACVPTGPADGLETGTLFFLHAINSAQKRLWIVSPYFVPDEQLMSALQLAALRGVDVRILIPAKPDHLHVYLAGLSYLEEAEAAGVKIFRYEPGFLHQKVWLIDDEVSLIGTANLDNRSMRLNFEVTMLILSREFATDVETMLKSDFDESRGALPTEYTERPLLYRFAVRICRLLAPIQ